METVSNRIARIIDEKCAGNRSKFARQVNITPAYAAQIYSGERTPSDRTISDICREFRVNENWLRTGEGQMESPVDPDQELADFFAEVYQAPLDDPCRQVIAVLQRINRNCPELFGEIVRAAAEAVQGTTKKED